VELFAASALFTSKEIEVTTAPTSRRAGRRFKSSVFIATSLDGFIARRDGDIAWLTSRALNAGETGYKEFMSSVDSIVMGRNTYEMALAFGREQWPYEGKRVVVLSTLLPGDSDPRIEVRQDLDSVVQALVQSDSRHVYVDGGRVVQSFLRAGLLSELTITTVPVLLGDGLPLFGSLDRQITLTHRSTKVLGAGFVQSVYAVTSDGEEHVG
jgi:dihydrofolate reductase